MKRKKRLFTAKPPSRSASYQALVRKINAELTELDTFIRRRTAEGYWRIGKFIDEHLLADKQRAPYGDNIFERLAEDVDRDASTLARSLQFYRAYPILAARQKLAWDHFRSLITIKDPVERKKVEDQIIRNNWTTKQLRSYLSQRRQLADAGEASGGQLTFTRGRLNTYRIVEASKALKSRNPLALDLGFRKQHTYPKSIGRFKPGDSVEILFKNGHPAGIRKSDAPPDELFTYKAHLERAVDGDTLIVTLDFNADFSISEKLRLRLVDCPELDAPGGKRAKRVVESRLKACDFIIVKTFKDRSDKFDRYLADIFYQPTVIANREAAKQSTVWSPERVAREGTYLNQELLEEGLAVRYGT